MKRGLKLPLIFLLVCLFTLAVQAQQAASTPAWTFKEVMIPVRDGVHLQTVIIAPADQKTALTILFRRTPDGVPSAAPTQLPANFKEFIDDGYIFVIQNLRGRFKSEGAFKLTSQ